MIERWAKADCGEHTQTQAGTQRDTERSNCRSGKQLEMPQHASPAREISAVSDGVFVQEAA